MQFWMGIGVGAILSLIASIVANLYSERIQNRLDSLKLARFGKRRDQVLNEYVRMVHLNDGARDKYLSLMFDAQEESSWFLMAIAAMLVSLLTFLEITTPPEIAPALHLFPIPVGFPAILLKIMFGILLLGGLIALTMGNIAHYRFRRRIQILNNFEEYRSEIMARWRFTSEEIEEALRPLLKSGTESAHP
jgi:hypothetical protein